MTTDAGPSLNEQKDEPVVEAQGKEIVVLVTGYGPFLDQFPINVSWSIASTLPRYIAPTASLPYPIRIIIPEKPLRVSYAHVAAITPRLLAGTYNPSDPLSISNDSTYSESTSASATTLPKPDIVLHIGLAAGRTFYTLERQSTNGPYNKYPDVDGHTFPTSSSSALFGDCPRVLKPTIDTDDLWRRWRTNVTDVSIDLRPSDDPGRYLCGFVYYLSMAWFYRRKREEAGKRPVVFLHVPDLPSERLVAQGRDVAVGLIKALVGNRVAGRDGVQMVGDDGLNGRVEEREGWSGISDVRS